MNKLNSILKLGNTINNVNCNTISIKSIDFWNTYIRGGSTSSVIKRVAINKKAASTSKRFTRCMECQSQCAPKNQKVVEVNNDECKPAPPPKKIDECEIKIAKCCKPNPCEFVCSGKLVNITNLCPEEPIPPVPKGNWNKRNP